MIADTVSRASRMSSRVTIGGGIVSRAPLPGEAAYQRPAWGTGGGAQTSFDRAGRRARRHRRLRWRLEEGHEGDAAAPGPADVTAADDRGAGHDQREHPVRRHDLGSH